MSGDGIRVPVPFFGHPSRARGVRHAAVEPYSPDQPRVALCGVESWTLSVADENAAVTCRDCLAIEAREQQG